MEVVSDDPAQTQSKKGTIMYLGGVEGAKGVWVHMEAYFPNILTDWS